MITLTSIGWVDEATDYPLHYAFLHKLTAADILSPLGGVPCEIASLTTMLPTGIANENFSVIFIGRVLDALGAHNEAVNTVKAELRQEAINHTYLHEVLHSHLEEAKELKRPEEAFRKINIIAKVLNIVNCTLVSNSVCANLTRAPCLKTPQTCGRCLHNSTGIVGDSNTPCYNNSDMIRGLGEHCTFDSHCLYGYCNGTMCDQPKLRCPTNEPGLVCSGHGHCNHFDNMGVRLFRECKLFDTHCTAHCSCTEGHGGIDCSLDWEKRRIVDKVRGMMCQNIHHQLDYIDHSPELLDVIIPTLHNTFRPHEIMSGK